MIAFLFTWVQITVGTLEKFDVAIKTCAPRNVYPFFFISAFCFSFSFPPTDPAPEWQNAGLITLSISKSDLNKCTFLTTPPSIHKFMGHETYTQEWIGKFQGYFPLSTPLWLGTSGGTKTRPRPFLIPANSLFHISSIYPSVLFQQATRSVKLCGSLSPRPKKKLSIF